METLAFLYLNIMKIFTLFILLLLWNNGYSQIPEDPVQLDSYLAQSEAKFPDITPDTEKFIYWVHGVAKKAPYSLVYLHGYSATRQETSPLTRQIANEIGANVFYTRLTGHGRPGEFMSEGNVKRWFADVTEAIRIGERIGEKVIVVSVSTGSTLSTWLAAEEAINSKLAAMVMISPNFALPDKKAYLLDLPYRMGIWLAEKQAGPQVSWEPINEKHANYWTYSYPIKALRELIRLLKQVEAIDKSKIDTPLLIVYSPNDKVIDVPAILSTFEEFGTTAKELVTFSGAEDPYQHVIAGDALSPNSTDDLAEIVLDYLTRWGIAP